MVHLKFEGTPSLGVEPLPIDILWFCK